jgi:hypothetical protein
MANISQAHRWTIRGRNRVQPDNLGVRVIVGQYTQAAGNLEGISRRTGNRVRQAADP